MKSQRSQAAFCNSQLGLWDEYAYQAIVIHAGCALAWWLFSLAIHPTNLLALSCCLASGWIVMRQCVRLTPRARLTQSSHWCIVVSVAIVSLLVWQASTVNLAPTRGDAIFGWWVLSILIAGCELVGFVERRKHVPLHQPSHLMDSPLPNDATPPTSDILPNASAYAEHVIDVTPVVVDAANQPIAPASDLKSKSNWGIKWALLLVVALLFIYMVIVPTIGYVIEQMTPPKTGRVLEDMTFSEKMRLHSVSGIVVLIFLALGATIGSFLNVFIYRVPRGRPLLWPPSSCASCKTRIHGKDNVPVFGWFLINGRCRTCASPISSRYPIIEAIVAVVFISLYYVELLSGGDNIPIRQPNPYRGIVWILLYTKWDLVGLYFYHCMMLCVLLAVAMMNVDGFRVPRRTAVFLLVLFALPSLAFPFLHPVPAPFVPPYATCLVGVLVGGGIGWGIQMLFPIWRRHRDEGSESGDEASGNAAGDGLGAVMEKGVLPISTDQRSTYGESAVVPSNVADSAFALSLVGIVLGPQAVVVVCVMLLPFYVAYFSPYVNLVRSSSITLGVFAVAVGHQLFWGQLYRLFGFAG